MPHAIVVDEVAKRYTIYHQHGRPAYESLRDVISGSARAIARRLVEPAAVRGERRSSEEFWALKGVSFSVAEGERLAVIGRNGAGKSTLLKVLSRITEPSAGRIEVRGRMASLLEVGTGFHPELSGRENIFLNGAIHGKSASEIRRRFDEIVQFAEIERFIDTPVKRYSSGMYVRLAFSVAAHLDPDILLVDEVLAVGDAEFQEKCLGKMQESGAAGRTVLFVSHNLGAVSQFCTSAILLDKGRISKKGTVREVVDTYLSRDAAAHALTDRDFTGPLGRHVHFRNIEVNAQPLGTRPISPADEIVFRLEGVCTETVPGFRTTIALYSGGTRLASLRDPTQTLPEGPFEVTIRVAPYCLRPGAYGVAIGGENRGSEWLFSQPVGQFTVSEEWDEHNDRNSIGLVNLPHSGVRKARERE